MFLVAPKKFTDLRLRQASWESFTTLNEVYGIEEVCKSPWQRRMNHMCFHPWDNMLVMLSKKCGFSGNLICTGKHKLTVLSGNNTQKTYK